MTDRLSWFKFYSRDWRGSARVTELTSAQRGIYLDLLCASWDLDGLPDDPRRLRPHVAWDATEEDTRLVMEGFFPLAEDGRRRSPRQEDERSLARARVEAGRKGGKQTPKQTPKQAGKQTNKQTSKQTRKQTSKQNASTRAGDSGLRTQDSGPRAQSPEPEGSAVADPRPAGAGRRRGRDRGDEVRRVVEHYRTHHPRACPKLTSASKVWRLIRARLEEGSTPEELQQAIDGYHYSPWHTGENPKGVSYLSLELIVRDADKVAAGLRYLEEHQAGRPVMSEREARGVRASQSWLERKEREDAERGVPHAG